MSSSDAANATGTFILSETLRFQETDGGIQLVGPDVSLSLDTQVARRLKTVFALPAPLSIALDSADDELAHAVQQLVRAGGLIPSAFPHAEDDEAIANVVNTKCAQLFHLFSGRAGGLDATALGLGSFLQLLGLMNRNVAMFRDASCRYFRNGVSSTVSSFGEVLAWARGYERGLAHVQHTYAVGVSMGCQAAIMTGHLLKLEAVWAFGVPNYRYPVDSANEPFDWNLLSLLREHNGVTKYHIYYGDRHRYDRPMAEKLASLPGVILHPEPTDEHVVFMSLHQRGKLGTVFPSFVASHAAANVAHGISRAEATPNEILRLLGLDLKREVVESLDAQTPLAGILDSFSVARLMGRIGTTFGIAAELGALSGADLANASTIASWVKAQIEASLSAEANKDATKASSQAPKRLAPRPAGEPPQLLRAIFDRARTSNDVALAFPAPGKETLSLSWPELASAIASAAGELQSRGVRSGEIVLIVTASTQEQVVSFLAAMALGALPTILSYPSVKQSPELFRATFNPIVEKSGARWVVCSDAFRDLPDPARISVLPPPSPHFDAPLDRFPERTGPLFMQFSSGTTGLRKGVVISEAMFAAQADAYGKRLGLTEQDCIVSWLPLYHDMGLVGALLIPLHHGIKSIHISPFDWLREPESFLFQVSEHKGTITFLPNFSYGFLVRRVDASRLAGAGVSLASLRMVINCSEPVRAASHREFGFTFEPLGLERSALHACYAMAETTFAVTQTVPGRTPRVDRVQRDAFLGSHECAPAADEDRSALEFVSCGTAIDGIEVMIDGAREERRVGEVLVRGDCVIDGYFGAPPRAEGEWFRTGDLGYMSNGELFVTGRAKDLIIHRGMNVWPTDVEEVIGGVRGCKPGRIVVFGVADENLGTDELVTVIEPDTDVPVAKDELVLAVRNAVRDHFGIRLEDVVIDSGLLKKSTSGKLSRNATREKYLASKQTKSQETEPSQYYKLAETVRCTISVETCELLLPSGHSIPLPASVGPVVERLRMFPVEKRELEAAAAAMGLGTAVSDLVALGALVVVTP